MLVVISIDNVTTCTTGWRRCIGCLKLQISFRKRATNFRALLQKTTSKDKASYGSTPPCTVFAGWRALVVIGSGTWLPFLCYSIDNCHLYDLQAIDGLIQDGCVLVVMCIDTTLRH